MGLEDSMQVLRALTDATRVRLLFALEDEELTVAELQRVLDVPQSRVSTHLARLKEVGLALDRTDGPHRYYRITNGALSAPARAAWIAVRQPLADDPQVARDRQRRDAVLAARGGASWVDRVAGSLDRHYSPGRTWEALARGLSLVQDLGVVADLGTGDGAVVELLAASARRVIGIDHNARMVQAGRRRLKQARLNHVDLVRADMHAVPLSSGSVDFVLSSQSLQYAERPAQVFREMARLLRTGGHALVLTLAAHDHSEVRAEYDHLHLGFSPGQLRSWARAAALEVEHLTPAGRERRPPQFEAVALVLRRPALKE